MYKVIGADGREYGPVTAEQLREWIVAGRANAQTMAQAEGGTDWQPLGSFAEIFPAPPAAAGSPEAPPPPAGPPPIAGAVNPDALAAKIIARDYQINIGHCIGRGWELVKSNFWLLVGASFLVNLVIGAVGILVGPLFGGLYLLYLKRIRNQPATVGDGFCGFNIAFLQLFLGGLVSMLLIVLGLILCVIPGAYLIVSWAFALPLIIEHKLDFWPAMELSRKVVGQHWWSICGLIFMTMLLNLLGLACCFIGVYVTTPIGMAALMYAYEDIFGETRAPAA